MISKNHRNMYFYSLDANIKLAIIEYLIVESRILYFLCSKDIEDYIKQKHTKYYEEYFQREFGGGYSKLVRIIAYPKSIKSEKIRAVLYEQDSETKKVKIFRNESFPRGLKIQIPLKFIESVSVF